MSVKDYYEILGIDFDAAPDRIHRAYIDLAQRYHPDVNADPSAHEQFLLIQHAYDMLKDKTRKAAYDLELSGAIPGKASFVIDAKVSRRTLAWHSEPQLVSALLRFDCLAETSSQRVPLRICLIIDCSTSMQGEWMDRVKDSAIRLVKRLSPEDMISIVSFSDRANVVVSPVYVTDSRAVINAIQFLKTGGGTEIFKGFEGGIEQMRQMVKNGAINWCFLLTDGHTYGDEESCFELARQAGAEGILLSALGFGSEWNDAFLDDLAGLMGGNALYVPTAGALGDILDEKMAQIGQVYAQGVRFDFSTDVHVAPREIFRMSPDPGPLSTSGSLVLGNLPYKTPLVVLLEFCVGRLPDTLETIKLITGKILVEPVGETQAMFTRRLELTCRVGTQAAVEMPPEALIEALSQLTLYRMQESARREISAGGYDKASQKLKNLATRLLARGDNDLAMTIMSEVKNIHQSQVFSPEGEKRIKYGTRALFLHSGIEEKEP